MLTRVAPYTLFTVAVLGIIFSIVLTKNNNSTSNADYADSTPLTKDTFVAANVNQPIAPPQTHTTLQTNSTSQPELQHKLHTLEKELADLQNTLNNLMKSHESDAAQNNNFAVRQQLEALEQQRDQLQKDYIETSFYSQPADAEWSREVSDKLQNGLNDSSIPFSAAQVSCGSTICRMTAQTEPNANAMAVFHALDTQLEWQGEINITVDSEAGTMTAYLGKEGNALPVAAN